jgi:hypothetical protein
MKHLGASLALIALGALGLAQAARTGTIRVDDPPPEPADCPLCGGDPAVHAAKTFTILRTGVQLAARTLPW